MTDGREGIGSTWHRWDPHVHTPGTLFNDQYGPDSWDDYLRIIETTVPAVSGLGITEYSCLRSYKDLLDRLTGTDRLQGILLFPNVELRLAIKGADGSPVNLHLLVCPDERDHVKQAERALRSLTFDYDEERFRCTEPDLIELGRAFRSDRNLPERAALSTGALQFKVSLDQVQDLRDESKWFRENVLIALPAGKDGLSSIAKDHSLRATRENLARLADIIFSGSPRERAFWLGAHNDFEQLGYRPKPCLHGSDAHMLRKLLNPDKERLCWVRATPTFEGLRQTLIEPERRVSIAAQPPPGPVAHNTIVEVQFGNAPWAKTQTVLLNPGLVTIIGMKGSGKTALADLIAHAAGALEHDLGQASFVRKARSLLEATNVHTTITWGNGLVSTSGFGIQDPPTDEPSVRYLSQHFVERLCGPDWFGRPLVDEIERVVFQAIPAEDRLATDSFSELLERRREHLNVMRGAARDRIIDGTERVAAETALHKGLNGLQKKKQLLEQQVKDLTGAIAKIPDKAPADLRKPYDETDARHRKLQEDIAARQVLIESIKSLDADVQALGDLHERRYREWILRYADLLTDKQWRTLRPAFAGDPKKTLAAQSSAFEAEVESLRRTGALPGDEKNIGETRGLTELETQLEELRKRMGAWALQEKRRQELRLKVHKLELEVAKLAKQIEHAQGAEQRRGLAHEERLDAYRAVFESVVSEVTLLRELYGPLASRLEGDHSLARLSFSVRRAVDWKRWADEGEQLYDLRRDGPFRGRGAIHSIAENDLLPAWRDGTPDKVRRAISDFVNGPARASMGQLSPDTTALDFAKWVFSTDHVSVHYDILYDGVPIERLSPGTRGVVLLTLYLALDQEDLRPLLVDQPEENLDPQSVYDDLVRFFRQAAIRRQIVMVTHNANLVVNTDSDQVIIANSERKGPEGLPEISYESGALEDPWVRDKVCSILEGGRRAFKRRGMRYGIPRGRR